MHCLLNKQKVFEEIVILFSVLAYAHLLAIILLTIILLTQIVKVQQKIYYANKKKSRTLL